MFCSKECKSIDQKRIYDAYIEKPCECCGNVFKSMKKENRKFCSYKCAGQNKKDISREIKYCKTCGKAFEERIKRIKNFCSEKCIREWQAIPKNITLRMEKTKKSVFKKYGVYSTFQVDTIRLKAINAHKLTGYNNINGLIKSEENKQKN